MALVRRQPVEALAQPAVYPTIHLSSPLVGNVREVDGSESVLLSLTHRVPLRHDVRSEETEVEMGHASPKRAAESGVGAVSAPRSAGSSESTWHHLGLGHEGGRLAALAKNNTFKVTKESWRLKREVKQLRRDNKMLLSERPFRQQTAVGVRTKRARSRTGPFIAPVRIFNRTQ